MALKLDACIAQHQGDRKEQQDRIALITHRQIAGACLAVVADGMGGHSGGVQAAEQVVFSVSAAFQTWGIDNEPRDLMYGALVEAHEVIRSSRHINEKDPHSTVVLFMLLPDKRCFWSHCGDSRLYCFRGQKMLFRSRDHSYMEYLMHQGKITAAEVATHPQRNILLTSLGGEDKPKIEFGKMEKFNTQIQGGDSFLLCSDGLWAYFSEVELGQLIAECPSAREAIDRIIALARERARGDGDNLSAVLLKFQEEEQKSDYRAIMEARAKARTQRSSTKEEKTDEGTAEKAPSSSKETVSERLLSNLQSGLSRLQSGLSSLQSKLSNPRKKKRR